MSKISFVIPVFNEAGNIRQLFHEILEVCKKEKYEFEVIFVDDCSTDDSLKELKTLFPVKIIVFRKNFGQTQALDAGIKEAKLPYIVIMDGDGQNDPADVPRLLKHLNENELDVVSGWRKKRKDSLSKRIMSRTANALRKILISDGIQDSGCSLKIYRREVFNNLSLYGEMHRFIPAFLKIKGFKVGEIEVNHRPRIIGKSKYSWGRGLKGFIDMISVWYWKKYAVRPLHLLGSLGIFIFLFGILCAIITIYEYLRGQDLSETIWPMMTLFSFLIGLQVFISGLITDMLIKTYYENRNESPYSIKQVIDNSGIHEEAENLTS